METSERRETTSYLIFHDPLPCYSFVLVDSFTYFLSWDLAVPTERIILFVLLLLPREREKFVKCFFKIYPRIWNPARDRNRP